MPRASAPARTPRRAGAAPLTAAADGGDVAAALVAQHAPTPAVGPASRESRADAEQKNRPLVNDIRLLGRILGDVIREQDGKEAFELIERVRQLSVAYRLKRDKTAGR
ncbi:MAG: phosphoenolpyruvate carboxylase, partial [Gammaproteobacteria bacterium]